MLVPRCPLLRGFTVMPYLYMYIIYAIDYRSAVRVGKTVCWIYWTTVSAASLGCLCRVREEGKERWSRVREAAARMRRVMRMEKLFHQRKRL